MSSYTVLKGRKFLPSEYRKDGKYVMLDNVTAEELFPGENPIGKKLTLNFFLPFGIWNTEMRP